ncbi:DUF4920 domain-containing protein [Urechidicola vernalis]|uniref:DUF4920 domain-containing protein n=1 Tax=Urechidicola vernalis TaxID=3075600 RepID=A0ABU2Y7B4_9FLAO|nr:DUF4920 domain-containing protein [Urechidicola sp. P050]MDT0553529.1 DUF4920 domain-containing protein [Urechidicola sp. P050]
MKRIGILIVIAILLVNCKKEEVKVNYASFGAKISTENALSKEEMMKQFSSLKSGDTIDVKFASKVNKVCKAKGCWMKIDLGDAESTVKFKDYGFFVPMNSEERKVIVNGKAYVAEVSVAELKHLAQDAGKSEEEIAEITEPKRTYSFMADGVLMEE